MLAHLGGGLPSCLYNAAVQHLGEEGGGGGHCNTAQPKRVEQHDSRSTEQENLRYTLWRLDSGRHVCIISLCLFFLDFDFT